MKGTQLQRIKKLPIRLLKQVLGELVGAYNSLTKGVGIEYSEIRPYVSGDDPRAIAWQKARGTQLFVKTFRQERDLRVTLFLDVSASMGLTQAKEITSLLVLAAAAARDRVGLGLFSDRLHFYLPNRSGLPHALKLLEVIEKAVPERRVSSFGEVLKGFLRTRPRRSLVIFVTDGTFLQNDYEDALKRLARVHDVLLIKVPEAISIPLENIGVVRFQDAENGSTYCLDVSKEGVKAFQAALNTLLVDFQAQLAKARVDCQIVNPQEDSLTSLFSIFRTRSKLRGR